MNKLSGGTSTGVMKLVGEAISINQKVKNKSEIKLLGIVCLERIKFNQDLIKNSLENKNV